MSTGYENEFLSDQDRMEVLKMKDKADNIVLGLAGTTAVTGAIPIPFADAPLIVAQQVTMMVAINNVFDFDIKEDALKSLVTAVLGVSGATLLGKTVVSGLLKCIPGVGTVAGGAISASTAGLITLALGKSYVQVCEIFKMGRLDPADIANQQGKALLQEKFKENLKNAKENG